MTRPGELSRLLEPLHARVPTEHYKREPWHGVELVPEERLSDLGYISAKKAKTESKERAILVTFLRELAARGASSE